LTVDRLGAEAFFTGVKRLGREADHLSLFSDEIKEWDYIFSLPYSLLLATRVKFL
jgi:hypothetical protein